MKPTRRQAGSSTILFSSIAHAATHVTCTPLEVFKNRVMAEAGKTQTIGEQLKRAARINELKGHSLSTIIRSAYAGVSIYGPQKFINGTYVPAVALTVAAYCQQQHGITPAAAGAMGGLTAAWLEALCNQGPEVIKVQKQTLPVGTPLREIVHKTNQKGFMAWTRGLGATIVRNSAGSPMTYASLVGVRRYFKQRNGGKDSFLGDTASSATAAFSRIAVSNPAERMKCQKQVGREITWLQLFRSGEAMTGLASRMLFSGSKVFTGFLVMNSVMSLLQKKDNEASFDNPSPESISPSPKR